MIGGGDPFYLKLWISDRIEAKSPISYLFSLVISPNLVAFVANYVKVVD